jgi:parvulin-like peptidyl-prolyl isomerase
MPLGLCGTASHLVGLWLAILLQVAAGCRTQTGTVVGEVGKETLTLEEVEQSIPYQLMGSISASQKREAVERWIEEELLYQEALRRGIDREPKTAALLDKVRRDILVASLLQRESRPDAKVSEEQIAQYYRDHQEEFGRDEPEIWVRHILVETRSEALRLRQRIADGEPFDAVARQESVEAESAANGGDVGYVSEEICDAAFWKAIFGLKTGSLSDPILTDMGYHVVEVLGKMEPGTVRALELVRPEIVSAILLEAQRRDRDALVDTLRRRAPWRVYTDRLAGGPSAALDSLP